MVATQEISCQAIITIPCRNTLCKLCYALCDKVLIGSDLIKISLCCRYEQARRIDVLWPPVCRLLYKWKMVRLADCRLFEHNNLLSRYMAYVWLIVSLNTSVQSWKTCCSIMCSYCALTVELECCLVVVKAYIQPYYPHGSL